MLSQKYVQCQVERLEGLIGFPKLTAAILELIKALQTAPSEPDVAQWITDWLSSGKRCPVPADIRAAFRVHRPETNGCQICGGYGWIVKERGNLSAAKRCICHPAR